MDFWDLVNEAYAPVGENEEAGAVRLSWVAANISVAAIASSDSIDDLMRGRISRLEEVLKHPLMTEGWRERIVGDIRNCQQQLQHGFPDNA